MTTLASLLLARIPADNAFTPLSGAALYLDSTEESEKYVSTRAADAAALLSELKWEPRLSGTLRASIYGHSIVWDIDGRLHAPHHAGCYEVLFNNEEDPYCFLTLQQVLAAILAKNW